MSAYRHSISAIQRSAQRSATGAAAYRSGERLVDVRSGAEYDYSRRHGVVASHIVVPGAPVDAIDRQALWAAVERKHTRGDAVTARELVVALPCELDPVVRVELTLWYARELADRYGVAVDVAVHLPSLRPGHDKRNHHAHLLMSACSVRLNDVGGLALGKKVEVLDPICQQRRGGVPIEEFERARWAALCNEALASAGRPDVVYDHRSYERQGVEQVPQVHLGPDAHDNLLRHRASPGNVVLLDRTRRYLEIESVNAALAEAKRYDAIAEREEQNEQERGQPSGQILELPESVVPSVEAVSGPSAPVTPIRPEPLPAPDTEFVLCLVGRLWSSLDRLDRLHDERRDSWQILRDMDRNSWLPNSDGLREWLERAPDSRREIATEITARTREISAQAQERSIERIVAKAAERREAARSYLSPVEKPVNPAPEILSVPSTDEALALVERLWRALDGDDMLPAESRRLWRVLEVINSAGLVQRDAPHPFALLGAMLEANPDWRREVVEEINSRMPELVGYERSRASAQAAADLAVRRPEAEESLVPASSAEQPVSSDNCAEGALSSPHLAPAETLGAPSVDDGNVISLDLTSAAPQADSKAPATSSVVDRAESTYEPLEFRARFAREERLRKSLVMDTEAVIAQFRQSYVGPVPLRIIVVSNLDPDVTAAEYHGNVLIVTAEKAGSPSDLLGSVSAAIRKRYGLALLAPPDRISILDAVIAAAGSELRDAWAIVNRRYPDSQLMERAERVFAYAARVGETVGRVWDAICARLATFLRAVGLLHTERPDARQIARELSENMRLEVVGESDHQAETREPTAPTSPFHQVIALISRLDVVLADDPRRHEWQALELLDSMPKRFDCSPVEALRHLLADPSSRLQLAEIEAELEHRRAEIDNYGIELERDDEEGQTPI